MTDNFELDLEGIKAAAKQDQLREGWYWFLARKWKAATNEETEHKALRFQLAPMEDPQDIKSVRFPTMLGQLDMMDGKFPNGPKSRDFFYGKTVELATAMFDELPQLPKKVNGNWFVAGEPLEKGSFEQVKNRVYMAVGEHLHGLWGKNDEALKELNSEEGAIIVAGRVEDYDYVNKKGERKSGRGVVDFCAELPEGAQLVPAGEFVDG